jgi:hypothetical protein
LTFFTNFRRKSTDALALHRATERIYAECPGIYYEIDLANRPKKVRRAFGILSSFMINIYPLPQLQVQQPPYAMAVVTPARLMFEKQPLNGRLFK